MPLFLIERNFAERGEVGASVHVTLDGEPVVDLWGGVADPVTGQEWSEETIVQVHGVGPTDITFVNPADDPRKKQ